MRAHRPGGMPRNRTGLRNKHRHGRSTYKVRNKARDADFYGVWDNGTCKTPERIRK